MRRSQGGTGSEGRLPGEAPDLKGPGREGPLPPRLTLCSPRFTPIRHLPLILSCSTSPHISEGNPN